jgi:hypothetical protein
VLHLRIISPPDRTEDVRRLLTDCDAATHVVVLPGAAQDPPGDWVLADVVREGTSELVDGLRALGIDRDGSIVLGQAGTMLSAAADRADRRVPGAGVDARSSPASRWRWRSPS